MINYGDIEHKVKKMDMDNEYQDLMKEKIYNIPFKYYKYWLEKNGYTFEGKKVLDFGCGHGITSIGLSKYCNCQSVVGVDIGDEYKQLPEMLSKFNEEIDIPNNVEFKENAPNSFLGTDEYDVIVSWSVLEHVSQNIFDNQIKLLMESLKKGGVCIIQVAPLYYSPYGSHLFNFQEPWAHLDKQLDLLEDDIKGVGAEDKKNMWNCFKTLNKYSAENFVDAFERNGMKLIDKYETYVEIEPKNSLLEVYGRESLLKEQILFLCEK